MTESVRAALGALQDERNHSWTPAQLELNASQRRELVIGFDRARGIKIGDPMPNFALEAVGGTAIRLSSLIATGPAVLIFFRFAGCPACNVALPVYQRALWPTLRELGVPLVAISPDFFETLRDTAAPRARLHHSDRPRQPPRSPTRHHLRSQFGNPAGRDNTLGRGNRHGHVGTAFPDGSCD